MDLALQLVAAEESGQAARQRLDGLQEAGNPCHKWWPGGSERPGMADVRWAWLKGSAEGSQGEEQGQGLGLYWLMRRYQGFGIRLINQWRVGWMGWQSC